MREIYKDGLLFLLFLFAIFSESIEMCRLFVFSYFLTTLERYISLFSQLGCFIIYNNRVTLSFFLVFKLVDALFNICDHDVTALPHEFLIR